MHKLRKNNSLRSHPKLARSSLVASRKHIKENKELRALSFPEAELRLEAALRVLAHELLIEEEDAPLVAGELVRKARRVRREVHCAHEGHFLRHRRQLRRTAAANRRADRRVGVVERPEVDG